MGRKRSKVKNNRRGIIMRRSMDGWDGRSREGLDSTESMDK